MSVQNPTHIKVAQDFGLDQSTTVKAEYLQDDNDHMGIRYVDKRDKTKIHIRLERE